MCDRCQDLEAVVAARLGMDVNTVGRVRHALMEAMRELDEAEQDAAADPSAIRMVPLGVMPFVLVQLPTYRPLPDGGAVSNVALTVGGGLYEHHVAGVLEAVLEEWELRNGGVDAEGNLIEPAARHD